MYVPALLKNRFSLGNLQLQCTCIFGNHWQSSEIFRKCPETIVWSSDSFWRMFGNLQKVFGNVRKIIKKVITNTKQYVAAWRYEFSLLVFNLISQLCTYLTLYLTCSISIHTYVMCRVCPTVVSHWSAHFSHVIFHHWKQFVYL